LLLNRVDLGDVKKALVPEDIEPAAFLGSKSLAGHFLCCYTPVKGVSFGSPLHEFGYLPCLAQSSGERGICSSTVAVDHPAFADQGGEHWGLKKVPGDFERTGDYGFRVKARGGRLDVSIRFRKSFTLGYWDKGFTFLSRKGERIIRFEVRIHGEVFFCRVQKTGIFHSGRSFPFLFDNCWVTIGKPEIPARKPPVFEEI